MSEMTDYHRRVRSNIAPLLPARATRILDVGCGVGATAAWLKSIYPGSRTIGLEGKAELLDELARNVDEPHIVDLNAPLPDLEPADLVLLLDVLEHLIDPEGVLTRIVSSAAVNATFIISLPNVAHLKVAARLLLLGRFDYTDAGILDRTHLRFFYRESALGLARRAGLEVAQGLMSGLADPKTHWIDRLSFGLLRDRLAKAYIFSAERATGGKRPTVDWRPA